METEVKSKQYSLNFRDVLKGLIMAALTPVVFIIAQSINVGTLVFDWNKILIAAIGGGVAYLIKNFFTPSQVVLTDLHPNTAEAIREGKAEATIVQKVITLLLFLSIGMAGYSQSFFKALPKKSTKGFSVTATQTQNVFRPVANIASFALPDNIGLTGAGVSYQHLEFSDAEQRWKVLWSINALAWYSTTNKILYGIAGGVLNNLIMVGVATNDGKHFYVTAGLGINFNN